MPQQLLELPAARIWIRKDRRRTIGECKALHLVDGDQTGDCVPLKTEEAKILRRRQRRLLQIDDEADAFQEAKRFLHIAETLLQR